MSLHEENLSPSDVSERAARLNATVPGRLKARLRPMRGLKTDRTAQVAIAGHAFMQDVRRGHYELGVVGEPRLRVAEAFSEISEAI